MMLCVIALVQQSHRLHDGYYAVSFLNQEDLGERQIVVHTVKG